MSAASLDYEAGVRKTNHFTTNNSIQSLNATVVFVDTQTKQLAITTMTMSTKDRITGVPKLAVHCCILTPLTHYMTVWVTKMTVWKRWVWGGWLGCRCGVALSSPASPSLFLPHAAMLRKGVDGLRSALRAQVLSVLALLNL